MSSVNVGQSQTEAVAALSVASHLASRLRESATAAEPWPHVFFENVFTADVYKRLCAALEQSEHNFRPQIHKGDRKVYHGSYEDRDEFRLTPNSGADGVAPALMDLYDALHSATFFDAVRSKFSDTYQQRFGEFAANPLARDFLEPTLLVTRHHEKYYIGPHTDRREKVITCIFNFAEREGLDDIGTALYVAKDRNFASDGVLHLDPQLFDRVAIAPFRPNSALIFARTDVSFHGVERLTQQNLKGSKRYNIQFNLWDWGKRPAA